MENSYFLPITSELIFFPYYIVNRFEELYHTVILWWFEQNLMRPNLIYLLQDIRKFNGELFDVHVFLNSQRCDQSVAFNQLATQ